MRTVYPSPQHSVSSCQWSLLRVQSQPSSGDSKGNNSSNKQISQQEGQHNGWLPRSRHKHCACCLGEYVYLIGGKGGTRPLRDMWRFHVQKQIWEQLESRGSCLPFLQGHTAVSNKKLIFIFGGTFSDSIGDIQLWVYNSDLGHLKEVWIDPGSVQPTCRRDHSAVMFNNNMYVYGGFVDQTGSSQEFWIYSTEEEEWMEVNTKNKFQPGKRHGHSAVVADNSMWLFGGMSGLAPRSDLWCYNFSLHHWKKVKGVGNPPALTGHTACVIRCHMIVVGGSCGGKLVSDTWAFNFENFVWTKLQQSNLCALPKLCHHAAVVFTSGSHMARSFSVRSAPHLKSAAKSGLQKDHFIVRPQSTPLGTREWKDPPTDTVNGACLPAAVFGGTSETQVPTLKMETSEEEWSPELFCDNSTNRTGNTDVKIDIMDRQWLLMREESGEYYDSVCWDRRSILQSEATPNESVASLERLPVSQILGSQSFPEHLMLQHQASKAYSSKREITASPNPGIFHQKAPKKQLREIRSREEAGRWDNIFVEDLESVDVQSSLSKVQILYPSRNPFQPPFSSSDFEDHLDGHNWCMQCSLPGCRHEFDVELQQLTSESGTNPFLGNMHLLSSQRSPHCKKGWLCEEHQSNWHEHELKSFDSSSAVPQVKCTSVTIGTQTEDLSALQGKASTVPQTNMTFSEAGGETRMSKEINEDPAQGEDIGGEDPFILVLGGRTEEAGSLYPKPATAWKGVFL